MTDTSAEDGITLVEIAVALVILGFVLTAFFGTITNGLRSLSVSRVQQTASQVTTEIIEDLRGVSPSEVAMCTDTTGDVCATPFVVNDVSCTGPGAGWFDPDGADTELGCEEIVHNPQGLIGGGPPWQDTVDGIEITTIATQATGDGLNYGTVVRVTVVAEYVLPGGSGVVRRSALFAEVGRG